MGSWLVVLTMALSFVCVPKRALAQDSYQGIWSRSTWRCDSKVSSSFKDKECSLEIGFNEQGECTWAELTYWWTSSTGILEPLICVSQEDGSFKIYRKRDSSQVVYEGRVTAQTTNLWRAPVLMIGTEQGEQSFVKGRQ